MEFEIIQLIKSFDKPETLKFRDFIKSPYFNKNTRLIKFYSILIKRFPAFLEINLQGPEMYKKVYGNGKYNHSTMRNLCYRLKQLLQQFIVVNRVNNNNYFYSDVLMDELLKRKVTGVFKNYYGKLAKQKFEVERQYFFYMSKYNNRIYNFNKMMQKVTKKKYAVRDYYILTESNLFFTIYYVTEIIYGYLNLTASASKYNLDTNNSLVEKVLKVFQSNELINILAEQNNSNILLNIYFSLLKTYTDFDNFNNYKAYKEIVQNHSKALSKEELSFQYSRLINYCILKQNKNEDIEIYDKELLELYTTVIREKLYKIDTDDNLQPSLFRAVVLLAFRVGDIEYLSKFIRTEIKNIDTKNRDNMYNFGMAYYYYIIGDLEKACNSINNIKLDYFIYKYDIKNLELKICFDRNELKGCLSIINGYKELIKRDKLLSPERKSHHRNFILYVEKLIKKLDSKRVDIEYFQNKLRNEDKVLYKDWLLKKYEYFSKDYKREVKEAGNTKTNII